MSTDPPPAPGTLYEGPPAENAICVILTIVIAGGYWILPSKNKWVLLALIYSVYAFIADVSAMYDCKRHLGPTVLEPIYRWTKPNNTVQFVQYKQWDPKIKKPVVWANRGIMLALLAAVPFFLSWNTTPSADPQQANNDNMAGIAFLLLCGVAMLVMKRKLEKKPGVLE